MIVEVLEWGGGILGYASAGLHVARTQSVECDTHARRRYKVVANQRQGWREQIIMRFLFWWYYGPSRALFRICEKPVVAAQVEREMVADKILEWTETEKYAYDEATELIARTELARLKNRRLELEA